jgi:hypothetical protein
LESTNYEALVEALRRALERRDALRPGTPAHWRAACEARALMKRVADAAHGEGRAIDASHVAE